MEHGNIGLDREIVFSLGDKPAETRATGYGAGLVCPQCRQAVLDYDGLLNVVCQNCGVIQGGCFT